MRIVNTYEDLQYPATRFTVKGYYQQSYKISIFKLHTDISIAYFKSLLSAGAFKLITKPNA